MGSTISGFLADPLDPGKQQRQLNEGAGQAQANANQAFGAASNQYNSNINTANANINPVLSEFLAASGLGALPGLQSASQTNGGQVAGANGAASGTVTPGTQSTINTSTSGYNPYALTGPQQQLVSQQQASINQAAQSSVSQLQASLAQRGINSTDPASVDAAAYIHSQAGMQNNAIQAQAQVAAQQQQLQSSQSLLNYFSGLGSQGAGGLGSLAGGQQQQANYLTQQSNENSNSGLGILNLLLPGISGAISGLSSGSSGAGNGATTYAQNIGAAPQGADSNSFDPSIFSSLLQGLTGVAGGFGV